MRSPFPGMDPFLEEPSEWGSVRARLLPLISDQLAPLVSPNFHVQIGERLYARSPDDPDGHTLVPDLYMITRPPTAHPARAGTVQPPTLVEPLYDGVTHDRYIEIRTNRTREVVTTIELLSPFHKTPGEPREIFLRKRHEQMGSAVHWIEIDLLRAGERPAEVRGQSHFYSLLKRGNAPRRFEVWFTDLRDRLPTIAVPLRAPHPDAPLDLQAVFDDMYSRASYGYSIDYQAAPPAPRLRPADAAWVAARVAEWGQRQEER